MGRHLRGRGPQEFRRGTVVRLLLGRGRREARARMVASIVIGAAAAITLAMGPGDDLHAPVIAMIEGEAPPLELDLLETILSAPEVAAAPRLETVDPSAAGLDAERLADVAEMVREEVKRGGTPGAALVLGRGALVVEKVGFGELGPGLGRVDPDRTLYDLASLTKVVATTTAVMLLVEDGRMELDAPIHRYLPEFQEAERSLVTVRHLLTHTSGLPAGIGIPDVSPDSAFARILAAPLKTPPGEAVVYSDLGPVILYAAAERAAGEPLSVLLRRRVFAPLGMTRTGFRPPNPCADCAPTTTEIHGRVHDPIAGRLGGIAGNAGLFSTAADMGRFAAMLANGGQLGGVRVLREETIRSFTERQPGADSRALGWETPDPVGNNSGGTRISPAAFGHTGFTGTSIWVDPDRGTWAVVLTNRTYSPTVPNRMQALRRNVNELLAESADLGDEVFTRAD